MHFRCLFGVQVRENKGGYRKPDDPQLVKNTTTQQQPDSSEQITLPLDLMLHLNYGQILFKGAILAKTDQNEADSEITDFHNRIVCSISKAHLN